jgi:hypothetical protein
LQAGIERTRHHDPAKAGEIEIWLERMAESYQVLPMTAFAFVSGPGSWTADLITTWRM